MSTRHTVLIVENDPATHAMYQRAFQPEYQVLIASSAEEVPSLLDEHTVHTIVLEPGPLGHPGWELLAELKRRPETRAIPVVVCTAQDERRRGLEMGATAYLVKPVLPAALLETVRRLNASRSPKGELP
jgi:DNA-binding response OmpR family regulator